MRTVWRVLAVIFLAFALAHGEKPIPAEGATVKDTLFYPDRVTIPKDVPSVEEIDYKTKFGEPRSYIILPTVLFLHGHYDGWQRCQFMMSRHGLAVSKRSMLGDIQSVQPYTYQGMKQGYKDCLKHLSQLMESGKSEKELMEYCKKTYRPRIKHDLTRRAP